MKKIQVSTVRQECDVEVLFVNSHLISKTIRAQIALENILRNTRTPKVLHDENGEPVLDANGKEVYSKDENGNIEYGYDYKGIRDERDIADLHDIVKSFIDELANAFE